MANINSGQKTFLDASVLLHSAMWAGIGEGLQRVAETPFAKNAAAILKYKGAAFGLAIGTAANGNFTKTAILTATGIAADIVIGLVAAAAIGGTLPITATVGISLLTGAALIVGGDYMYENWGGQYLENQITDLGTAIGQSISDIMNHDWEAEYAKGKASFEQAFQQKANEFKNNLKEIITDLQNSGNEFAQSIDNTLSGFSAWLADAKETIFSEVEAAIQSAEDALFELARPDMGDVPCEPFVLDLNGDGVKLTGATDGTAYFDLDADGIREKVGWVSAEDGLLVRDLNGNGKIDNINELIGDQTTDSYTILRDFDQNNDGKITSADNIWSGLKVWQDKNSNGVTDAGELKSLAHHKITKYAKNDNTLWVLNNQAA